MQLNGDSLSQIFYRINSVVHDVNKKQPKSFRSGLLYFDTKLMLWGVILIDEKQVFRKTDETGMYVEDIIGLKDEAAPAGCRPLLETVMEDGKRKEPEVSLESIRSNVSKNLSSLADSYKILSSALDFPVKISDQLLTIQKNFDDN
ncbi:MAG: hypothetical protein U5L07_15790 [Desulfobacterales bacterium]|nr:hypothetical protein [Desulfobacterales bacterium]